ncbi:MarR family transcriptional regulator [Lactiplantibacillus plantarum]|uniref:MarR family transcriptional regulator n=1 Tax=Lactiplantibacillus plantarum TaxID=1590 RepID=UPI001D06F456|nr:MarR family transcriptional regulator [Lactiplantibacillus plantarum]MCB7149202.1 MarR family transcriptional regulator [Lactiplantibacillus plantarum]MCB7169217.1 MarR family transcriptional regulator [Lactiplantibacillus plantarum]
MPKTIRELADELDVSKQRIQQIITKLSTSKKPNKEGNRYILNNTDVHNIKAAMGLESDNSSTIKMKNRVVDYDVYLDMIESMKEKDGQIKSLLEIQKKTQNLLDQQQRLSLQDKRLLEEYKLEIKNLKALNAPSQDTEKDNSLRNIEEKSHQKNKKWWLWW